MAAGVYFALTFDGRQKFGRPLKEVPMFFYRYNVLWRYLVTSLWLLVATSPNWARALLGFRWGEFRTDLQVCSPLTGLRHRR